MADDKIYVAISLEADEDQPVADLVYCGVQWASMARSEDDFILTLWANTESRIPLADALASIEQAKERLTTRS